MKKEITIQKQIDPIASKAETLTILSGADMTEAVEILSQLKTYLDKITAEREKITKPMNEALKEVRGRYKPVETLISDAIASIRSKMTVYQTEQLRIQKEEEQKIAARVGEGKGYLKIETAVAKIAGIEKAPDKVVADTGLVKFKTLQKFEVMDVSLLPSEYLLPNDIKIREAMKQNVKLPGVRYFTEEIPINFR